MALPPRDHLSPPSHRLSLQILKHPTPPIPLPGKNLFHLHRTRSLRIEPPAPALFASHTRFGAVLTVVRRLVLGVDVLAVDVLGAGDPGGALVAAGVALLEAVELVFGAEGVEEAHCVFWVVGS